MPKPIPTPYNMRMAYQITIRTNRIDHRSENEHAWNTIRNYIHGPTQHYYSMLLDRLWLKDDKITCDWGNNMIKI